MSGFRIPTDPFLPWELVIKQPPAPNTSFDVAACAVVARDVALASVRAYDIQTKTVTAEGSAPQ